MTDMLSRPPLDLPSRHGRASIKTGADPMSFPTSLAGTWPAPESADRDVIRHVAALDAVSAALSSCRRYVFRPTRSLHSASGSKMLFGGTNSQGPMDLIASLAAHVKDFVSGLMKHHAGLGSGLTRSKS